MKTHYIKIPVIASLGEAIQTDASLKLCSGLLHLRLAMTAEVGP